MLDSRRAAGVSPSMICWQADHANQEVGGLTPAARLVVRVEPVRNIQVCSHETLVFPRSRE